MRPWEHSGRIIVLYKALTVKANVTTVVLLTSTYICSNICAVSYTHIGCALNLLRKWQCCLLTAYQLQTITHSNEPNINMAYCNQQNEFDKQPCEFRKADGIYSHIFLLYSAFYHHETLVTLVKCLWTSHDTPTCYLLSHCQFEQPVYLSTSSVAKRCVHSYRHLHCDYSVWVVTLSVLELVQLAGMFRFIVVC